MKFLKIIGGAVTDTCFSIVSRGEEITWNVTRLNRDAREGRFGRVVHHPMTAVPKSDWSKGNLDREKVDAIKRDPRALAEPSIAIQAIDANGKPTIRCFADGQHRITARQELGMLEITYYLVPVNREHEYRVIFEFEENQS